MDQRTRTLMNRLTEKLRNNFSVKAALERFGKIATKGWTLSALGFRLSRMDCRMVLVLMVITIAAYDFVGLFYRAAAVFILRPGERKTIATTGNESDSPKDPLVFYKVVLDRNLFGSTDRPMALKQGEGGLSTFPDSASNWELRGTVACSDHFGFAIVEDRVKRKQSLVKVGDKIADATLIKVARDTIVLRIGDREETLRAKTSVDNSAGSPRVMEKTGPLFAPPTKTDIPPAPPDPAKKSAVPPSSPQGEAAGAVAALKRVEKVTPMPVQTP